jgi:predicted dehydrogenase
MKKGRYNAVVVGAGSIGAMKPDKFDSPKTKNILTIAHAFYKHPRINFVGIVDTDLFKLIDARKKWGVQTSRYISEIDNEIDILALCIPTEFHYPFIKNNFDTPIIKSPKILLAEKPFCETYNESTAARDILRRAVIPTSIDYIRRYDKSMQDVKSKFDKGSYGEAYSCTIHYDRGLYRDGCHAIDICNFLFGKNLGGSVLPGRRANDYDDKDLSYPVHMVYEKCGNVFMIPGDGRAHSIFEIDIIFEKVRIKFVDHGLKMETYNVEPEKTYGSYKSLSTNHKTIKTGLHNALYNYVDNAVKFLDGKEQLICTAKDAVETQMILEDLTRGKYL